MATHSAIIAGVFTQESQAKKALDELQQAGFDYDQIGVATQREKKTNLLQELEDLRVPREQAKYYDEEFRAGRTIVSVRPEDRWQVAQDILRHNGAYSYEQRTEGSSSAYASDRGKAGVQPGDPAVASVQKGTMAPGRKTDQVATGRDENFYQPRSLKLREEQLTATKERVQTGEVELHKEVVAEQKTINVPVTHEEVVIERHAVSGEQADPTPIGEGETIRVPVNAEQVNVNKNTAVTGEVTIGKRAVQENKRVNESVQREEVRVEHEGDVSDLNVHDEPPSSGRRASDRE